MAKMLDGPVPDDARSVSWPWYHHTLTNELTVDARQLLQEYSRVKAADIESHVYKIRDRAWGVFPWPCVGEFWFLSFGLAKHPLYARMVLPRLKAGASLLDLGACLGQDIRKCIFDGAPATKLYSSDLIPAYEDLAYALWRDEHILPRGRFLADDILADNDRFTTGKLMTELGPGQIDIISITMFLHLFNWQNQLRAATRILRLLSHKPGSLVLGSQAGSTDPGEVPLKPPFAATKNGERCTVYRHNPESFELLWKKAGAAAGVPLRVTAVFQRPEAFPQGARACSAYTEKKKHRGSGVETRRLYFSVMRG